MVYVLLLTAAIGLVFHNVLDNGFTYDDQFIVVQNEIIRALDLGRIFSTNYWHGYQGHDAGLYRPLVILSYALTYRLAGLDPFFYHMGNLALHLGCSLLVLALGRRLMADDRAALMAALLFALHPVHTEVVANVAGRKELLAGLFFLGAWRVYWDAAGRPARLGLAAGLFLAALMCKEDAVALWGVIVGADLWRQRAGKDGPLPWHRIGAAQYKAWALMALPVAVYLGLRLWVLGSGGAASTTSMALENPLADASLWQRLLSVVRIFGRYFELLLWPLDLKADYSLNQFPTVTTPLSLDWAASLLGVAGSVALGLWGRWRFWGLAVFFFYATLAIVCNLLFTIGTPLAERFLYIPSAAFCWGVGLLLARLWQRRSAAVPCTLLGLLLLGYGLRSAQRNAVWRNNATFFARNVETSPNSARARYILGMEHYQAGRPKDALEQFARAVAIAPNHANAHYMLGRLHGDLGAWQAARQALQKALDAAQRLGLPAAYQADVAVRLALAQGEAALDQGDRSLAEGHFTSALEQAGPSGDLATAARTGLARVHLGRDDIPAARRALDGAPIQAAARLVAADISLAEGKPAAAQYRRAVDELMAQRRWHLAAAAVAKALQLAPADRALKLRQARINAFRGDLPTSIAQAQTLAKQYPTWPAPHRYLGDWYIESDQKQAARPAYETFLRLERNPQRRAAIEKKLHDAGL